MAGTFALGLDDPRFDEHHRVLPRVPDASHDPKWWLLNEGTNWFLDTLSNMEVMSLPRGGKGLALTQVGGGRSLAEPGGSFGGLVPPSGVAVGPGRDIWLVESEDRGLKIFDSCSCTFLRIPCLGGEGDGPRELGNPTDIAVANHNLYIADAGNGRVSIFSLRGYVLREHWAIADGEDGLRAWEPRGIAADSRGRIYVTDPANGCLHRFGRNGIREKSVSGLGAVGPIAIDCDDRIFIAQSGDPEAITVLDTEGGPLDADLSVRALRSRFHPLPFGVDREGNLLLGALCPPGRRPAAFDLHGNPVIPVPTEAPSFALSGECVCTPLDSGIHRCQWHRVVVSGALPNHCQLRVYTFASDTLVPSSLIGSDAWTLSGTAMSFMQGEWDALVRSGPGRYLWLRVEVSGDGPTTPVIGEIRVEFPRVSVRRYLPAVLAEDAAGADFTDRFLANFDTTLRSIESQVDGLPDLFDPMSTSSKTLPGADIDFLTWLASWIGVTLDRQRSERDLRRMVKGAARQYPLRGTLEGMRQQLIEFLGLDPVRRHCPHQGRREQCIPRPLNCGRPPQERDPWRPPALVLEHYRLRRWLHVGSGRLGDNAVLWGRRIVNRSQLDSKAQTGGARVGYTKINTTPDPLRDPFHKFAHQFTVFVPAALGLSSSNRRVLSNLVNSAKPAHTSCQVELVEPRFRVGFQSMIGFDSVIGRYPRGVRLGKAHLGRDAILEAPANRRGGVSLEVGKKRIGTTLKLD